MTTYFNMAPIATSWRSCLKAGLTHMDPTYLASLRRNPHWLPGKDKIFNAFSLPLNRVNYVLFGESPYPRAESANGYAFWDAAVDELWSTTGLDKKVNRATSLRNMIKMLLIAEGLLDLNHTTQQDIALIDKKPLVKTNQAFFKNFLKHGFLLLNATPVLQTHAPHKDARHWYPFINHVLRCLLSKQPKVKLILFGQIARALEKIIGDYPTISRLHSEHPYNHSFITNKTVLNFFKPLHLLIK